MGLGGAILAAAIAAAAQAAIMREMLDTLKGIKTVVVHPSTGDKDAPEA